MISKTGRKIFFVNPPNSLKETFLENVFKKEFEIYLLENRSKLHRLLENFNDAIVFINIDYEMSTDEWLTYIGDLQEKYKRVVIAVFSANKSSALQKTLLMDMGIKGGFINLEQDNWKTVEVIIQVLEANEARGRRKSVRFDLDKNEQLKGLGVKIFSMKGYQTKGDILSFSSAGLLVKITSGQLQEGDQIERTVFVLDGHEIHVKGYLLKTFDNGNIFVTFEEIQDADKDTIQSYIFRELQISFNRLLRTLR